MCWYMHVRVQSIFHAKNEVYFLFEENIVLQRFTIPDMYNGGKNLHSKCVILYVVSFNMQQQAMYTYNVNR